MPRRALLLLCAALACSHAPASTSVLQPLDLESVSGTFSADEIVPLAAFVDASGVSEGAILSFLQQTPYGRPSFLATYESNGVTAAAAIADAARSYGLNPLIFLARAEMDAGLVGLSSYPSTPSQVEYAFGCGCEGPGDCAGSAAGFDVQVDCLGAALRQSLDAIANGGKTGGGWGPGLPGTTLDGVRVTPADASTAALYQYSPVVAVDQPGGTWLVWNLWHRYATALGYAGPPSGAGSWIGAACSGSSTCVYGETPGVCASEFPGGLCTLVCTADCPTSPGEAATFCADFGAQGGYCLAVCDPKNPTCRSGYTCTSVKQVGDTTASANVCFP